MSRLQLSAKPTVRWRLFMRQQQYKNEETICVAALNRTKNEGSHRSTTVVPAKKLATDPVCGMTVDPANAESVEYREAKFYFCCQGCAAEFQAEPAKYLQPKQDAPLVQVLKDGSRRPTTPVPCTPRCIRRDRAVARNAVWRWSRRPLRRPRRARNTPAQCTRDRARSPGSCPICGMALEPRTSLPTRRILNWSP